MPISYLFVRIGIAGAFTMLCASCSLSDLVKVDPATQNDVDANLIETYPGSISLYYSAVKMAATFAGDHAIITGLMTDEMQSESDDPIYKEYDARTDDIFTISGPDKHPGAWPLLAATQRAIDALRRYPNLTPRAYLSELYALQGMAIVWMAEAYCSGLPLTSTPLAGNFSYTKGYTTAELLDHAVVLFDSALSFGEDSVRIAALARVGKARALINLNKYAEAASAVTNVPTDARYLAYYNPTIQPDFLVEWNTSTRVVNAEGSNGLRWIAESAEMQDPRVPMTTQIVGGTSQFTSPVRQAKYQGTNTTKRLADGVEARLIEAEAALHAKDTVRWAQVLNTLRASAIVPAIPALPADSTLLASANERVNVMFRERAYWLYLTGHRQGDLRRLVRQYGRTIFTVYPIGAYAWASGSSAKLYNDLVTIPPPDDEVNRNPLYDGCIDRNP